MAERKTGTRASSGTNGLAEDYAVRMRHADYLASAGVGVDRIAIEVLYLLPPGFVREYTRLFHAALNIGEDGMGERDAAKTTLGISAGQNTPNTGSRGGSRIDSSGKTEIGSGTGRGGGSGGRKGIFGVRDEGRLEEKDAVDRVLRKLARKMRSAGLAETGAKAGRKCGWSQVGEKRDSKRAYTGERDGTWPGARGKKVEMVPAGCAKFLEAEWKYCPWCGWAPRGSEQEKMRARESRREVNRRALDEER